MQRLRALSEAECYARCYGWRGADVVRIEPAAPRQPRFEAVRISGEEIRRLLEDKLDSREPEAA